MSRIGKLPINIPAGVTVDVKDNVVTVKGPKGELSQTVNPAISVPLRRSDYFRYQREQRCRPKAEAGFPWSLSFTC